MLTIISHATHIVKTTQINAKKVIFVAFDKARNPMRTDLLMRQLKNHVFDKLRRWRHASSRKGVDTLHKLHLHVQSKVPLSEQMADCPRSLFCLEAAAQGGSVDCVFSSGRTEIGPLLASQISNRS